MSVVSVASRLPPRSELQAATITMLAPVAQQAVPAGRRSAAGSPAAQSQTNTTTSGADTNGTIIDGVAISCADIQKVQNLIEKCLQLYMNQEEVVKSLKEEAQIQPRFTTLVWQKLEEQNPEFFRAYYTRLKLKDQIVLFNHLLEQQVQMFQKIQAGWNPQLIAGQVRPGLQIQTMPNASAAYSRPTLGIQPVAVPSSGPQVIAAPVSASAAPATTARATTNATTTTKAGAILQQKAPASATQTQPQAVAAQATVTPSVSAAIPITLPDTPITVAPAIDGTAPLPDFQMSNGTSADLAAAVANGADATGVQDTMPRNFSLPDLTLEGTGTLELLNDEGSGELDLDMPML